MILSLRVDRLYERRVVWANELSDKASESYQQLSYETERAVSITEVVKKSLILIVIYLL